MVSNNIYKKYVVKSIFVWICIVLMCIGWVLTIIQTNQKYKLNLGTILNKTITSKNESQLDIKSKIKNIFTQYGGHIIFVGSWFALCLIEIFWKPYSSLK